MLARERSEHLLLKSLKEWDYHISPTYLISADCDGDGWRPMKAIPIFEAFSYLQELKIFSFFLHSPPRFVGLWVLLGRCKHFEASPEGDLSFAGPITAASKELCVDSSPPRTLLKWYEGEDLPIGLLRFPASFGDDNCFRFSELVGRNDQPFDI